MRGPETRPSLHHSTDRESCSSKSVLQMPCVHTAQKSLLSRIESAHQLGFQLFMRVQELSLHLQIVSCACVILQVWLLHIVLIS